MAFDVNSIIWLVTLFVVFGVFLGYELFGRDEPLENLSYVVALLPGSYLWYAFATDPDYAGLGTLGAFLVIMVLWLVSLVRDVTAALRKKKDMDDVVLFLVIGVVLLLILSAVLPHENLLPELQAGTTVYWRYFYLPDISPASPYSSALVLAFKGLSTVLVLTVVIPLVFDLKGVKVPAWVILIILALFAIPLAFVSWLWLPSDWVVLLVLELVVLGIVFLRLTAGGEEELK
ncbi:MAG: hypothetical protein Kow0069_23740 [Promethearchaeota archaeon]